MALERTAWQSPVDAGAISERGKLQVCCAVLLLCCAVLAPAGSLKYLQYGHSHSRTS